MPRNSVPHRHKILFSVIGAVALVVFGVVIGFVVLLSGAYSTAATKQHFALTYRILELGLKYSVNAYAKDIEAPRLDDPRKVERGVACYRQYCVQCHGAPGVARAAVGQGMLPEPSNLSQSAREWPPTDLYYVTRKGVRMAGMPAWEFRMSDAALWDTVAFLKAMTFLDAPAYDQLLARAAAEHCPPNAQALPYSRERAQTLLRQYACHNCHLIDDVVGPDAHVGPPLHDWHRRKLIAGVLPNTRENLRRWIVAPTMISPNTLMPDLDVTEAHAQDMARYLFEGGG